MITREISMAMAIMENHMLIPLLPRFNIRMGFGEETVEEVCNKYAVNTDFFLEICNSYIYENYTLQNDLSLFSLGTMIDYLKNTHYYYTEKALPKLEKQIHSLLSDSDLSNEKKNLVSTFFNDYKQDFLNHIQKEEVEILPYILELEKQYNKSQADTEFIDKINKYSIREFAREHERLESSLTNLSKLIIKYLPPFQNWDLCNQILIDLSGLVKDLVDHANMEDKVLIPRVAELEQALLLNNSDE